MPVTRTHDSLLARKKFGLGLLLGLLIWTGACGNPSVPVSADDVSGPWDVNFANASADLELLQKTNLDLGGTLQIDDALWSVTGSAKLRPVINLYILPIENEALLFESLNFSEKIQFAVQTNLQPAHAADKVTLRGILSTDGHIIKGTATSALLSEVSEFSMTR